MREVFACDEHGERSAKGIPEERDVLHSSVPFESEFAQESESVVDVVNLIAAQEFDLLLGLVTALRIGPVVDIESCVVDIVRCVTAAQRSKDDPSCGQKGIGNGAWL